MFSLIFKLLVIRHSNSHSFRFGVLQPISSFHGTNHCQVHSAIPNLNPQSVSHGWQAEEARPHQPRNRKNTGIRPPHGDSGRVTTPSYPSHQATQMSPWEETQPPITSYHKQSSDGKTSFFFVWPVLTRSPHKTCPQTCYRHSHVRRKPASLMF